MTPNVRVMAQADLVEKLEDTLYGLRLSLGEGAFPRTATQYLDDWAVNDKGWLRKFYPPGSDEAHFDLPFAGELIQVRPEEQAWEGAAERLLHNFGLSLLVPDRHYTALAE